METLNHKMTNDEFQNWHEMAFLLFVDPINTGAVCDPIEQTLMKNIKSIGGITHGRGFTESVLNKWICRVLVAHHVCEAMEKYCQRNNE